jgi:hypothetical protein
MTITSPIPTIQRHESSTRTRNYAHPVDGVVERTAVAMLKWTRAREARAAINGSEHSRQRQQWGAQAERDLYALRLTQRLGL